MVTPRRSRPAGPASSRSRSMPTRLRRRRCSSRCWVVKELLDYTVDVSGGDRVFNQPLKDWELLGTLPEGVVFHKDVTEPKARFTGQAQRAGHYVLHVRCTDSYSPPKATNWVKIELFDKNS